MAAGERIDPWDDYFPQILLDFLAEGHASLGSVSACEAELMGAQASWITPWAGWS